MRRRAIARSFSGFAGAAVLLCITLDSQVEALWLSRAFAPISLLPAVGVAGCLAQHLDRTKKGAILIGVPTIVAMGMMIGFSFYAFSEAGERHLKNVAFSVVAIASLGLACVLCYGVGLRRALRLTKNASIE